jgi:hypothetical protein
VVQRRLQIAQLQVQNSPLLSSQGSLVPNAPPINISGPLSIMPGATVNNIGQPFEDFVLHALALKLQCLVDRTSGPIAASCLFPPALGFLLRPPLRPPHCTPRHQSENEVVLSICIDPPVDLAKLCTQTAALLMPSSVSSILSYTELNVETISKILHLQQPYFTEWDCSFSFTSVCVVSKIKAPNCFPVVCISPRNDLTLHKTLVDAMCVPSFDPIAFHRKFNKTALSLREVQQSYNDMVTVTKMAECSVKQRQVMLFQPTDATNPMCDTVAIMPMLAPQSVCFIFIELKDKIHNNFTEKLDNIVKKHELMLAPVVSALQRAAVTVLPSIYVCCGRQGCSLI